MPNFEAPHYTRPGQTSPVSTLRLNLLRLAYLILAAGLALVVWPTVLHHTSQIALRSGPRLALLAGLGLTAVLGLRYPLAMLPLLLFELTWKTIFLLAFALPLALAHQLTPDAVDDIVSVATVVIFLPLIPWRFVYARYLQQPAEPWR